MIDIKEIPEGKVEEARKVVQEFVRSGEYRVLDRYDVKRLKRATDALGMSLTDFGNVRQPMSLAFLFAFQLGRYAERHGLFGDSDTIAEPVAVGTSVESPAERAGIEAKEAAAAVATPRVTPPDSTAPSVTDPLAPPDVDNMNYADLVSFGNDVLGMGMKVGSTPKKEALRQLIKDEIAKRTAAQ